MIRDRGVRDRPMHTPHGFSPRTSAVAAARDALAFAYREAKLRSRQRRRADGPVAAALDRAG